MFDVQGRQVKHHNEQSLSAGETYQNSFLLADVQLLRGIFYMRIASKNGQVWAKRAR